MAKFLALFLITTAALTTAQCPPNTRLCGSDILDNLKCGDDSITLITPKGNDPRNCNFFTNSEGTPQARGACCCAEGRCITGTCD